MSEHEEWLKRQLDGLGEPEELRGVDQSIVAVVSYNQLMVGGRYDMAVAHLLMASGYTIYEGLTVHEGLSAHRTMTDEQLKHLAITLTWADLEVLLSQLGLALWKALWRSYR